MRDNILKNNSKVSIRSEQLYRAVWRWHFYAGLFVVPFLLILSLSGVLMLLSKPIEPLLHQNLLKVTQQEHPLTANTLLNKVSEQYPHSSVKLYIPPRDNTESAQFSLQAEHAGGHGGHNAPSTTVYINPYNAEILGTLDPTASFYNWVKVLHSSLYMGDIGDTLLEIAAGLGVLMVLSGVYLAWPKNGWRSLVPRFSLISRKDWRSLHRIIGLFVAIPLVFFLISGLAWTNVWGGKLVQPWSSLPRFEAPKNTESQQIVDHESMDHAAMGHTNMDLEAMDHTAMNHDSMNHTGMHHVPWVMEQTPMPESAANSGEFGLNAVNRIAAEQGFANYRVHFPQGEVGVWTISATTMAGDITNPLTERTLHLDRFSGEPLAEFKFADYPVMGKAMAAFIPLHQGDLGLWNLLLNLVLVAMVLFMMASGLVMWWKRRPKKQGKLGSPMAPPAISKLVGFAMIVVALCFPLSALALIAVIILDSLLISRVKRLQTAIK